MGIRRDMPRTTQLRQRDVKPYGLLLVLKAPDITQPKAKKTAKEHKKSKKEILFAGLDK